MDYQEEECLICSETCWSGENQPSRFLFSGSRYLGKDCPALEAQLKQVFILRKILDIPSTWVEEKLGGGDGESPNSWFGVCGVCSGIVEEAVEVHHKILKLEGKMMELKEKVKEKMGSGRTGRRRRRGGDGGGIKEEIRQLVVGVEELKVEKSTINYEEKDDDDDDFELQEVYDDNDESSDPEWNEDDGSLMVTKEVKPDLDSQSDLPLPIIQKRRGPGRPPRGEERPKDVYLTKDGKVRRFTFHWRSCRKCPAKFKHEEDLNTHFNLHDTSTHPCPVCCFPCKNEDELETHRKKKHEGYSPSYTLRYGCVNCEFVTYSRSHLDNHCACEHTSMTTEELARTRCPPCSKTFGSVKSLAIHQHRMHPELFGMEALPSSTSTSPIQCSECGIYVSSRLHLDYHIRNTHERVQRHICEECGKGFKFQCHLEAHMIVHRTEREFVCHLCGLDYPVKQSLVKHMSKFHSDAATKSEESGGSGEIFSCKYCELTSPFKVVIQRHQLTHKKEMGHQCEICQKCYTSDAGLRRHIRINHPAEEEVVECPFCRKPFGNKDYMQDHMKKFCQVRKATEAAGRATTALPEEPQPPPFKLESIINYVE